MRSSHHVQTPYFAYRNSRQHAAGSRKFYSEIFGWETTVTQPYDYTTFKSGSIGGAFPRIGEYYQANDVLVYIESVDVDADIVKIKAMGGQQVGEKFEIPGEGCQIRFIDPSGNHLALWQSYKEDASD